MLVEEVDGGPWRLCVDHAVEFLNSLRTVEPTVDAKTFVLAVALPV